MFLNAFMVAMEFLESSNDMLYKKESDLLQALMEYLKIERNQIGVGVADNHVVQLILPNIDLKNIPEQIKEFNYLEGLHLENNNIKEISDLPQSLIYLNLSNNEIVNITGLYNLPKLHKVYLSNNPIDYNQSKKQIEYLGKKIIT